MTKKKRKTDKKTKIKNEKDKEQETLCFFSSESSRCFGRLCEDATLSVWDFSLRESAGFRGARAP